MSLPINGDFPEDERNVLSLSCLDGHHEHTELVLECTIWVVFKVGPGALYVMGKMKGALLGLSVLPFVNGGGIKLVTLHDFHTQLVSFKIMEITRLQKESRD
jgi:hypothetical protein